MYIRLMRFQKPLENVENVIDKKGEYNQIEKLWLAGFIVVVVAFGGLQYLIDYFVKKNLGLLEHDDDDHDK